MAQVPTAMGSLLRTARTRVGSRPTTLKRGDMDRSYFSVGVRGLEPLWFQFFLLPRLPLWLCRPNHLAAYGRYSSGSERCMYRDCSLCSHFHAGGCAAADKVALVLAPDQLLSLSPVQQDSAAKPRLDARLKGKKTTLPKLPVTASLPEAVWPPWTIPAQRPSRFSDTASDQAICSRG